MARASLSKDPDDVASMFDGIARRYDRVNDVLSLGQDRVWRHAVVRALQAAPGERVLDLAAGTGASSVPLAEQGAQVVACDLSVGMLAEGKARHPELTFVAGDATALPFADGSFDAVTISFGLRNVSDVDAALQEMLRVIRPGGRLLVCEFSTPVWRPFRKLYSSYLVKALPLVAGWLTREPGSYDYLAESIQGWPPQRELGATLRRCGWHDVEFRNLTGGIVALHRAVAPGADA